MTNQDIICYTIAEDVAAAMPPYARQDTFAPL